MKTILAIIICLFCSSIALSNDLLNYALEQQSKGNHKEAFEAFITLAEQGDDKAMLDVGNKYYFGEGVEVNYTKAFEWWLKAFNNNNGDAPGNIGVLYRDGKGIKQNRKIAYLLFAMTHMEGLGTQETQYRVNSMLRREMAEQDKTSIQEALCYTREYLHAHLESLGKLESIPDDVLPMNGNIRFKDNNWWLPSEIEAMKFECPPPWN